MNLNQDELFGNMIENSVSAGWKVSVVDNYENVGEYIYKVLKENQSRLAVRSRNNIFNRLVVDILAEKL